MSARIDAAVGSEIVNGGRSLYNLDPLNAVELILILLATSVAFAICADRLRLPYPMGADLLRRRIVA